MKDSTLFANKLTNGEEVICPTCNIGLMKPVNYSGKQIDIKKIHHFKCSKCGTVIEFLPADVIIT